jgi:glutamate racemase
MGGLTVLRELRARLPAEDFIYLGDTARLPYGTKSAQTVTRYAVRAAQALCGYGVKGIVVACNTASAVGLGAIRDQVEDRFVLGVLEPGAQAACEASRSAGIAVIATEGTVRGGAYERALRARRSAVRVESIACPLFVALAEEGLCSGPIAEAVARHYLGDFFSAAGADTRIDTLLLGCTHFPVLADAIRAVIGPEVALVDSAVATARATQAALAAAGLARSGRAGTVRLLATDGAERFARVGSRFFGAALEPDAIELVDLV